MNFGIYMCILINVCSWLLGYVMYKKKLLLWDLKFFLILKVIYFNFINMYVDRVYVFCIYFWLIDIYKYELNEILVYVCFYLSFVNIY